MSPAAPTIYAERLDLIPMTAAFLRASLKRDFDEARRHLPLALPADWPGDLVSVAELRLGQLEKEPSLQPWLLRAMCDRKSGAMVGCIGFHNPPGDAAVDSFSPGAVEFGFTVFSPFRRKGYAREASLALMRWAARSYGVTAFILSISPENVASRALAAELGFVRIGSHIDKVDGLEDVLELRAC